MIPLEAVSGLIDVAGGVACGVIGWAVKTYATKSKAADREDAREQTRTIVVEELRPALLESNTKLLATMNGTYLRTSEARIEFSNIKEGLRDLNHTVTKILEKPAPSYRPVPE